MESELFTEADIVHTYTLEEGIEDGVFAEPYPKRWPKLVLTSAVHEAVAKEAENRNVTYDQVAVPLIMDAIMISQNPAMWKPREDSLYTGDGMHGNATDRPLWLALNDAGGMTIMFPEDY